MKVAAFIDTFQTMAAEWMFLSNFNIFASISLSRINILFFQLKNVTEAHFNLITIVDRSSVGFDFTKNVFSLKDFVYSNRYIWISFSLCVEKKVFYLFNLHKNGHSKFSLCVKCIDAERCANSSFSEICRFKLRYRKKLIFRQLWYMRKFFFIII